MNNDNEVEIANHWKTLRIDSIVLLQIGQSALTVTKRFAHVSSMRQNFMKSPKFYILGKRQTWHFSQFSSSSSVERSKNLS